MIELRANAGREGAREKLVEAGLLWDECEHQQPYWSETEHVCMDLATAEVLEDAANEMHELCLRACGEIVERGWWERLSIPAAAAPLVEASWRAGDRSLYGRFDFAWTGEGEPKLLEYNADTPTSLLEAAVLQWQWLEELFPEDDQLNSLHEGLVERWREFREARVHLACVWDAVEDRQTIAYLAETAEQAGKTAVLMDMGEIGYAEGRGCFTDVEEGEISRLFALYPWEWMVGEEFFAKVGGHREIFTEPLWKMMLANKAILPILWELFPNHRLLAPAFFEEAPLRQMARPEWVEKPIWGREGAGILMRDAYGVLARGEAAHEEQPRVYQQKAPLWQAGGQHFVWGLWIIGDTCRGLSARGDRAAITSNRSRFFPHRIV